MDMILVLLELMFSLMIWIFTIPFLILYGFIDIFPDFVKWSILSIVIIGIFLTFFSGNIFGAFILSVILYFQWRAYSIQENVKWEEVRIAHVPNNIYDYFSVNPGYLIAIVVILVFMLIAYNDPSSFFTETDSSSDSDKDEYYSSSFSPSEERDYHRSEKIRSITRKLKR
jgi:hypothetical protein